MKSDLNFQELRQIGEAALGGGGRSLSAERVLFISSVGSHMWGMNRPESDIDLVVIYAASTVSILRGQKVPTTIRQEIAACRGEVYDTLGWEAGHLIDQLIRGNVNAIWYTTSPLIVKPSPYQEELAALVAANLSRSSYHSIRGMAESQIKSEDSLGRLKIAGKGYRTALRTIKFGINLLTHARICFEPVLHTPERSEVMAAQASLDEAYLNSSLPDRPDEGAFRDFLLRLRLEILAEERGNSRKA